MNDMRLPAPRFDFLREVEKEQNPRVNSSPSLKINFHKTVEGSPVKRREISPTPGSPTTGSPQKKRKVGEDDNKRIAETGLKSLKMNGLDNVSRNSTPPPQKKLSRSPTPIKLISTEEGAVLTTECSIKNDKGETIISQGEILNLSPIGKPGKFHKVWTCGKGKNFVIKTWHQGSVSDMQKKQSYQDTVSGYDLLISQEEAYGKFHVAKLYNKDTVWENGFYVYELIEGREPTFEDVKTLFIEMIKDSSRYIADFRPANAIIQTIMVKEENDVVEKEQVVLIDPSIEKKHEKNYDFHLATTILTWMPKMNKIIDIEAVKNLISEFNTLDLTPVARENWIKTAARLDEKCRESQTLNQNV